MTTLLDFNLIAEKYNLAERRLIMLDYDGTLVPFAEDPRLALPDNRLKTILWELNTDRRNEVVLISGRKKDELELYFGEAGMTLVAEHGGFYRLPSSHWHQTLPQPDWIGPVSKAIRALTIQYEGSFIEEKFYSVAWHYRAIASAIQHEEIRQIIDAIHGLPDSGKFIVDDNHCTLELRTPLIGKGVFLDLRRDNEYTFKMALGDGRTDEDLFGKLNKDDFAIRVGPSDDSLARFHLTSQSDVLPFLNKLLKVNGEYLRMRQNVGLDQRL